LSFSKWVKPPVPSCSSPSSSIKCEIWLLLLISFSWLSSCSELIRPERRLNDGELVDSWSNMPCLFAKLNHKFISTEKNKRQWTLVLLSFEKIFITKFLNQTKKSFWSFLIKKLIYFTFWQILQKASGWKIFSSVNEWFPFGCFLFKERAFLVAFVWSWFKFVFKLKSRIVSWTCLTFSSMINCSCVESDDDNDPSSQFKLARSDGSFSCSGGFRSIKSEVGCSSLKTNQLS